MVTVRASAIAVFATVVLLTALGGQARAQGAAYGLDNKRIAQDLARKALASLERGEEATTTEEKLAAYTEGLALAKRAVAADDSNADAHFALFGNNGRLMLLNGIRANPLNLLKASSELERTLALDPNHADALAARGGLYRQLPWMLGGSLEKAEADLRRAVALNPSAVGARIELARVYREKGQAGLGRPLLEEAARLAKEQARRRKLEEAEELLREITTE